MVYSASSANKKEGRQNNFYYLFIKSVNRNELKRNTRKISNFVKKYRDCDPRVLLFHQTYILPKQREY